MVLVIIMMTLVLVAGGYLGGTNIAPDPIDTPKIEYVNEVEFRIIDEELGLSLEDDNIKVDNEGNVVYVTDKSFEKVYKVGEEEGDIGSEEYLEIRKEYRKGIAKELNYGVLGSVITFIGVMGVLYKIE